MPDDDAFNTEGLDPLVDLWAESETLGAAVVDPASVRAIVRPSHFWSEANAQVFAACLALHERGEAIDVTSVRLELEATGHFARHWRDEGEWVTWWLDRELVSRARRDAALDVAEDARLRALRECGQAIATAAERREPHEAIQHAERAAKLARWQGRTVQERRTA